MSTEEEREWGFAPPNGGEWPLAVKQVADLIINSRSNERFSVIRQVAYLIHNDEGNPDIDLDYERQVGQVAILTNLVQKYTSDLLPGGDYGPGQQSAKDLEARGVAGYLLQHATDLHREFGHPPR